MNDRPNILLILTDQQRGDCIGLAPHEPALPGYDPGTSSYPFL